MLRLLRTVIGPLLYCLAVCEASLTKEQCTALSALPLTSQVLAVNASYVPFSTLNATLAQYPSLDNSGSFCRIYGRVSVLNQSIVNFELWLPGEELYNGRFLATGNGGYAGFIDEVELIQGLAEGLAVAGGDGGHTLAQNTPAKDAPQYYSFLNNNVQTLEWIRNSIAAFSIPSRTLQAAYYGVDPLYSYYTGCSTGGAQAFALAERHPDMFDGIYAQCPGNWYSHLILMFLWNYNHAQGAGFLDQAALNFITMKVLDECDTLDGVRDGILEDLGACEFNITSLQCGPDENPTTNKTQCLTPAQISTAKAYYQGPRDSRNGAIVYHGFEFGSESSWLYQESFLAPMFSTPILQNLVYNLTYNISDFNFGSDIDTVDAKAGSKIDSIITKLQSFFDQGGRLILTQGLADPLNPASWPTQYLQEISTVTANASDYIRLSNIPGGGHCGPSPGYPQAPAVVSYMQPLMRWVGLEIGSGYPFRVEPGP